MSSLSDLTSNIEQVIYSPTSIQRAVFTHLEEITNGELTVVDTSNPFTALLSASATMVAAAINKADAEHRRQYEKASITLSDLYDHISDRDIYEIYAQPSQIKVQLSFSLTELLGKLVLDSTLGIHKLIIPRNTKFTVAETTFSLQYPIEIRKLEHGGLTVVYDNSVKSPLKTLETNAIPWGIMEYSSVSGEWLTIELNVEQFDIITKRGSVVQSQQFKLDILFDDLFYTARVYVDSGSGYKEIPVVLSARIVDLTTPCAVITVFENLVQVTIPQIFTHNGQISGTVRVDIYQTKGDISLDLSAYPVSEFIAEWKAIDTTEFTAYSAPLRTLESIAISSSSITDHGRRALTVDEIRTRILANAIGPRQLPITPAQINIALTNLGYELIKNIDVVTDRVFLATRELIAPKASDYSTLLSQTINPRASSGISANIGTLITKLSTLTNRSGVIDNGLRMTITPNALFVNNNGVVEHLSVNDLQHLQARSPDLLALELNSKDYRYTPFHYVLDATTDAFDLRAYYLDNPTIDNKLFVTENASSLLQVGIDIVDLVKTNNGYSLLIRTISSDAVKELLDDDLICQLATIPSNERDRAYINGTLYSVEDTGERIYEFEISTRYDLDSDNNLILNNFFMYSEDPINIPVPLKATFDVFFITTAEVGNQYTPTTIDSAIGRAILPFIVHTINHEQLVFNFGHTLKTLWKRSRSFVDETMYQRYTFDIPMTYDQNVYENNRVFEIVNDEVVYNQILHHAGDIIYENDGVTPRYSARAGDIILENGSPIVISNRVISRHLDLILLDGLYYFVTDESISNYKTLAHQTLAKWIVEDLTDIEKMTLDETTIFYYPKVMIGTMEVIVNDNRRANIRAEQSLVIDLSVTDSVYTNDALKNSLVTKTTTVLKHELSKTQIAVSSIIKELKTVYGNDVIDVRVTGLGGTSNFSAITIVSDYTRCSLKKKMVVLADGSTTVVDDVTFNWIRHTV